MINTADFRLHQGFIRMLSLWLFDMSQQVKSVIPKYSRMQNRDQTSNHVVIFR